MNNKLVVVDMQNDFIDGAIGTKEAQAIVPAVIEKIKGFQGEVLFTRDTHFSDYLDTQEGKKLPVLHCIKDTDGWQIESGIDALRKTKPFDKVTFGSKELVRYLVERNKVEKIDAVTFVGLCTDICVISNALMLKAYLPEAVIAVDASCCAGSTPQNHKNALAAMQQCHVEIAEGE